MSNPGVLRDKYLKTLYDLRGQRKLTQNDVVGIKAILDAGIHLLYTHRDTDFDDYFDEMLSEMARHRQEKGDSWKTIPYEQLKVQALKAIWEIITPDDIMVEWNPGQLVDFGNYCAMLWKRRKEAEGNE